MGEMGETGDDWGWRSDGVAVRVLKDLMTKAQKLSSLLPWQPLVHVDGSCSSVAVDHVCIDNNVFRVVSLSL